MMKEKSHPLGETSYLLSDLHKLRSRLLGYRPLTHLTFSSGYYLLYSLYTLTGQSRCPSPSTDHHATS